MKKIKMYTLNGNTPNGRSWEEFIKNECEERRREDEVIFYGYVNCNYILFPDGMIHCNYGFWGDVVMNDIVENGCQTVQKKIIDLHNEIQDVLKEIK